MSTVAPIFCPGVNSYTNTMQQSKVPTRKQPMHRCPYIPVPIGILIVAVWVSPTVPIATKAVIASDPDENFESQWPQWRGPWGTGFAPRAEPPIEWDENNNIRWRIELPGKGHSTPIAWGQQIYVTAAVPTAPVEIPHYSGVPGAHDNAPVTHHYDFVVLAVSRSNGEIAWKKSVRRELPHEGGHHTGSLASASATTDGKYVFAFFGSYGLYCLDRSGNIQWEQHLGQMQSKHGHGEGSSPALYRDTLIVNWDHEGQSFIIAFDKHTGHQKWKIARDEVTSWATPIVVEVAGKAQVVVSGTQRLRGYDLQTGAVIWECDGLSANIVASPLAANGMVYAGSSYEKKAIVAVRLVGATGNVTGTNHIAWTRTRLTPYVPSPVLLEKTLYFLGHYQGVLSCVNATTGEDRFGPFRINGLRNIYSSPVAAAGRVYITDREGMTVVFHGNDPSRILAQNHLDDSFSASAALVGRDLLLRGERFLYCISQINSNQP